MPPIEARTTHELYPQGIRMHHIFKGKHYGRNF